MEDTHPTTPHHTSTKHVWIGETRNARSSGATCACGNQAPTSQSGDPFHAVAFFIKLEGHTVHGFTQEVLTGLVNGALHQHGCKSVFIL